MLAGANRFSAPAVKSEGPFPLGPFPRHIWIHDNTPQDGLDKACHEIWKRVQSLPWGLQPIACMDPPGPPWSRNGAHSGSLEKSSVHEEVSVLVEKEYSRLKQSINEIEMQSVEGVKKMSSILSQTLNRILVPLSYRNWLLDETEGLESIYRAVIGNREREMKLRALCDAQLSAKSTITNILRSASFPRSSKGLEGSSTTGAGSMEGSKLGMPLLLKHTDTAKGPNNQVMPEESKAVKEFIQNGMFSAAKNSTAVPTPAAESQTAGQKQQQLSTVATICSRPDSSAATKALQNPVTTAMLDKKIVKYNANTFTPRFSATTTAVTLNQPMWPSLSFPPLPLFPNHPNFPPFQGLYHQRARIPFQQALHPSFGCYSRQGAPFSPQQMLRSPYTPLLNYIPLVQPGFPFQRAPPQLPTSIQDPPPACSGTQYPFPPPYRFGSAPGGAVRSKHHYPPSGNCVNF